MAWIISASQAAGGASKRFRSRLGKLCATASIFLAVGVGLA